jgi:hypothetical protein
LRIKELQVSMQERDNYGYKWSIRISGSPKPEIAFHL